MKSILKTFFLLILILSTYTSAKASNNCAALFDASSERISADTADNLLNELAKLIIHRTTLIQENTQKAIIVKTTQEIQRIRRTLESALGPKAFQEKIRARVALLEEGKELAEKMEINRRNIESKQLLVD